MSSKKSSPLTHIHFNFDRPGYEPLLGAEIATLCGKAARFIEKPEHPICPRCFTISREIISAENAINKLMTLQRAKDINLSGGAS